MEGAIELVARDAELAVLRSALARADTGRGSLVLVTGEAGIGKSTLARVAMDEARSLGATLALGRAWEFGEAPPYFPLLPCFSALGLDPAAQSGEPNAFRAWERLLPALAGAARRALVVFLVEDVHAADLATLDLLALLAQPLTALRALVIATARPKDPRVTERVAQRLTRMARDGEHVPLEPLGVDAVRTLVERSCRRSVPDGVVKDLLARTGGNPLFVVECAFALRARGAARGLPDTVRQVVLERVQLLPSGTQRALAAAAVLGREATAFGIARIRGELPAQVIDALEPALRGGILDEIAPARYVFTHILVRDAIEDALPAGERQALHAAAAAALATQGDEPDVLVERARHALTSLQGGAATIELGLRAAEWLERRGAFDRAHAMRERIQEAREAGNGSLPTPLERLHAARVAQRAGQFSRARETCLEVVEVARAASDAELLAEAALALGAEIRPGVVDRELVQLLEEARSRLPEARGRLSVRVLARLAAALQPAKDPNVPLVLAREALALAHALGDESTLVETLVVAGSALIDFNDLEERRDVSEELARRATAAGDLAAALRGYERLAMTFAEMGRFAEWDGAVERVLALCDALGTPRLRWRGLLHASMRALARGDISASDRAVHEVSELEAVSDDPALVLSLRAHLHSRAALLHRDEELARTTDNLASIPPDLPEAFVIARAIRAAAFARVENRAAARAELVQLADYLAHSPFLSYFGALAAEASAFVEDMPTCRLLRTRLAAEGGPEIVGGHVPMIYGGPRVRLLGMLASALGEHEAAEAELRAARDTVSAAGFAPWMAQIDYDLGVALERAGRARDARAQFEQAVATARQVPMPGLVERALRRRAALGGGVEGAPSPEPAPPPARLMLERRGDLWHLEYAGASASVRDSRGMQLLARLVERAGEEIHVLALASDDAGTSLHDGGAGEAIDARAQRAYRTRLSELETDIARAEHDNDRGRLTSLQREHELIERELARALGLGGRARGTGSPSERARVNVQRRLKDAIARISEVLPDCGRFLDRAVRTGNYCSFTG